MTNQNSFRPEDFRRVSLTDAPLLIPLLTASCADSCECVFDNLYLWGFPCGTAWQVFRGHAWFHLPCMDELFFAEPKDTAAVPVPDELFEVAAAMRAAGGRGSVFQVRKAYLDTHPAWEKYFHAELLPDSSAEYIYSVDALVELSGAKLRKKRNLIKQFQRDFPDYEVLPVTPGKVLDDCLRLSAEWRAGQDNPDTGPLRMESAALSHLPDGLAEMGAEGVAVYVKEQLAAYAIFSRISDVMFTESFEKSRPDMKGAAQLVNHEMAKRLQGRCLYINREQDLGSEGLRHAKLSYDPVLLLKNYRLTLK